MFRKLTVAFESLDGFQREYQRNMANGGMFVPTDEPFEFREVVDLELVLRFCDKTLLLQSEIVSHRDLGHMEGSQPLPPGVAVQFLEPTDELRHVLSEAAGLARTETGAAPSTPYPGAARRSPRFDTRAPAQMHWEGRDLEGHTRNLSRSGALLCMQGRLPDVGSPVRLSLVHPRTRELREVAGRVVRHGDMERSGAQIAVEFQFEAGGERARRFVEELCFHGGVPDPESIAGPLDILGLPSLVQMFSSSSDEGTLEIWSRGTAGQIVFAGGALQCARAGTVSGMKGLARLLAWREGRFEFHPVAEITEETSEPVPMYGAILEGLQHVDELQRLDLSELPPESRVERVPGVSPGDLSKEEQMLLDLLEPEMSVERLISRAPVFDSEAYAALIALRDGGVLRIVP